MREIRLDEYGRALLRRTGWHHRADVSNPGDVGHHHHHGVLGAPAVPAVIFGRKVVITDPTPDKVAQLLGLNLDFRNDSSIATRADAVVIHFDLNLSMP